MSFLKKDYEIPSSPSNYTKLEEGITKIRVLPINWETNAVVFWEYFKKEGDNLSPVRSLEKPKETPNKDPKSSLKEKWSMKIYNYNTKQVEILSVGQKGIKQAILDLYQDVDYGSPLGFDLKIKRTGKGLETTYSINPAPPSEFDSKLIEGIDKNIDWVKYLDSDEPFVD